MMGRVGLRLVPFIFWPIQKEYNLKKKIRLWLPVTCKPYVV